MTESKLFLLDTNILVYGFENKDDIKNRQAKDIINNCWQRRDRFAVSAQNLAEFAFVSTKKAKLDFEQIKTIIEYINDFEGFVKIHQSIRAYRIEKFDIP